MSTPRLPRSRELWWVDFRRSQQPGGPVGHEQGMRRPALIVSNDDYNASGYGTHVVVPLTTRRKNMVTHVPVEPPEVPVASWIRCEDVRNVSNLRIAGYIGRVGGTTYAAVCQRLRWLLDL